jgi:hypothetical protein
MLKHLLVHVPSESLIRPIVDGAVSLAAARAAVNGKTYACGFIAD